MRIIDVTQGTDEWRAARAGIATASNFSAILARGTKNEEATTRRNLRIKLVLERLTGRQAGGFESYATRQGTEREPLARQAYEVATGEIVRTVGFVRHDLLETGASPDGLIAADGGLEIKSPEPAAHLEAIRAKRVPTQYFAQVQGNLWICERRWWRFVSFNPDFPSALQLVIITAYRDDDYIDKLHLAVSLFMDEVRDEEAELRALL